MGKKYKIVISDGSVSREAELPDDDISIRVGTTVRCDIRIAQLTAKEPVELEMRRQENVWTVECPENVYFTDGGVRKQIRRQLEHGDRLTVFLQGQSKSVCTIDFVLNFESRAQKYDRVIDIRSMDDLIIGGNPSAALFIEDPLLESDFITLSKKQGKVVLADYNARYGAYVNGVRVDGERELCDTDFFSVVGYSFYYKDGLLYTDSENGIRIKGLRSSFDSIHSGNMEYPKFVRNVRKKIVLSEEPITILDPEQKPQQPKNNIFMQLLPAIGSLVLVVLLRGVMGGGGSFVLFSACSMALGMVTTVVSFVTGNKDYKKELEKREKDYSAYVAGKRREIETARREEALQLSQIYIPSQQQLKRVFDFSGDLFDRQYEDEDFLCVRLGEGQQKAKRPIKITVKETITAADELAKMPQSIAERYEYIPNAPIFVDLKEANAVGVIGDELRQIEMAKIMTLDLASRHYFSDVKMLFVLSKEAEQRMSWLRWLPHVENDMLGVRNIVCDEDSKNSLFEFLFVELSAREQQKRNRPNYIVFVMDDKGMKSHPMSKYISTAKEYGFVFVFFENRQDLLPQGCDEVISLERGGNRGTLMKVANVNDTRTFTYTPVRDEYMERMAVTLSPVYSEEVSLENSLTKNISLFEMLGIFSPADIDLEDNWKRAAVYRSMAAPLGVKANHETVYLDLHEKAHGPHGLVAGTTGSGKSELLQSYIISASILFHPYEVGFVIIDFKGGGMANQFRDLPHLMGAITNIDGAAIQRSLKSIKAELLKRQALFAEAGVNKIDDYIKLYKRGEVAQPIPHLIIVVDEFAELKAEQPEFMKELISAARIGRSLGVHLILATQKPAGQVDDQIWSNSRFKLCLKVATPQDSNEVLKTPLAAEIREPGRAYLQVGNNEIFELFQSGYSGGPAASDASVIKEFRLCSVSLSGVRDVVFSQKKPKNSEASLTQLDAVVRHIHEYCETASIRKLPDICLPPLPSCVDLPVQSHPSAGYEVELGLYDDPENQRQAGFIVDLSSNNLMIIGSSQTGKTNMLQAIIRSLTARYTPAEVSIYILDFASMVLKNFEQLNHVGGVVTSSEDEKLKNLFKLLRAEIETRKEKLISVGVSSFAAYKEAGETDLPLIVLMIDNLTALKELYFQDDDELVSLCRDGLTVGICIVVANSHTSGIGYKYLSNFSGRIVFYCNDSSEYNAIFDHCHMRIDAIPGRCIVEQDSKHYECQSYLAFHGEREIERVREIRAFASEINERYGDVTARAIPVIPSVLTAHDVYRQYGHLTRKPFSLVAGLDYSSVAPVALNLAAMGHVAIVGREGSGRHNWVQYALETTMKAYSQRLKVYVVDGIAKRFAALKTKPYTQNYSIVAEDAAACIKTIEGQLQQRYEKLAAGDETVLATTELLVLVMDNADALQAVSADSAAAAAYKNIIGRYKNLNVCVITMVENVNIPYSAPDMLKTIRDSHHMLFFDDLVNLKIFDVQLSIMRRFKKPIEQGDCYYIRENECIKLKTPLCE